MAFTPYAATSEKTVREAFKLANVNKDSIVYDVGAGDGRIAIEAAKLGANATAIEANDFFLKLIDWNAEKAGVTIKTIIDDALNIDYSPASHIFMGVRQKEVEERVLNTSKQGALIITLGWEFAGLKDPKKEIISLLGHPYLFRLGIRNFESIEMLYPLTVKELIEKMPHWLEYFWAGPISNSVWIYTKE